MLFLYAEVVKLAYTQRSGRCGGNPVEVQVLSSAQIKKLVILTPPLTSGEERTPSYKGKHGILRIGLSASAQDDNLLNKN